VESLLRLLEDQRAVAGVDADWRRWFGDDVEAIRRWRRRGESLARSLPSQGWQRRRIVELDDETIVAIDDETGHEIVLAEEDRIVHELDLDRLTAEVAAAIELDGATETIERGLIRLGDHLGVGGSVLPVFFAIAQDPEALVALASRCAAREARRLALITPTMRLWSEPLRALLRSRDSLLITAGQLLEVRGGALVCIAPLASLLNPKATGPAKLRAPAPRFPTPPRSTWRDVRIKFLDGDRVSIKVGVATQVYTYTEMGFIDHRDKSADLQWELLRVFARSRGELCWSNHASTRRNKARAARLRRALRQFFGIAGDPVVHDEALQGWRLAFEIESDCSSDM